MAISWVELVDRESNDDLKDRAVRLFVYMIHWFVSKGGKYLECERRCEELCSQFKYWLTSSISWELQSDFFLVEWRNYNFCCEELLVDKQKKLEELDDCVELDLLTLLFDSMVLLAPF